MSTPGEDLIAELDKLRTRLNNSGVERTQGLRNNLGKNCQYYKKSMDKFLHEDYIELRNFVNKAKELIQLIEGPSNE